MRLFPVALALALAGTLAAVGCSGDHDRLKKKDPVGGEGGTGGTGGAGGTATGGDGGSGGIVEPPGDPKLTVVNGTVDEDGIRFCFVPYPAGATTETPFPANARLDFARASTMSIDTDIPTGSDVEVVVITGTLAATTGRSCAELIATPPADVIAMSHGVLPESAFTTDKSVLLVTAGCIGGRNHQHSDEEQICGPGYAIDLPTATLAAGFMSRISELSRLPLQFTQASLALPEIQLRFRPQTGSTSHQVVNSWSFGQIGPYPPYDSISASQVIHNEALLETVPVGNEAPLSSDSWAIAMTNGGSRTTT